ALLAVVRGEEVEERAPLQALLADLDRDQLRDILLHLVNLDPDLAQPIEDEIRLRQGFPAVAAEKPRRPPAPELRVVRQQMVAALRNPPYQSPHYSGWHSFRLGSEANQLLDQAWDLIRAGEGAHALEILNVMTDECVENWQA